MEFVLLNVVHGTTDETERTTVEKEKTSIFPSLFSVVSSFPVPTLSGSPLLPDTSRTLMTEMVSLDMKFLAFTSFFVFSLYVTG